MMIEERRFLELAVHVKLASEAMIAAARNLSALRPADAAGAELAVWARTMDDLITMNVQLGSMERILRKVSRAGVPRLGAESARKVRTLAP